VEVADRGPGLSAEQTTQVGQRFWRGDQGRQHGDGAGLGISIVRAIVERFGGRLDMNPREGGGLVAALRIPLSNQRTDEQ
jgi:two-component system sensor histidine kinase QseC